MYKVIHFLLLRFRRIAHKITIFYSINKISIFIKTIEGVASKSIIDKCKTADKIQNFYVYPMETSNGINATARNKILSRMY